MLNGYVQVSCSVCESTNIAYRYNGEIDAHQLECDLCGRDMDIIEFADITEVESILDIAESELESANYHDMIDMPRELYYAIVDMVNDNDRLKLARTIYDIVVR